MAGDKTIGALDDGGFLQPSDEIPIERPGSPNANFRVRGASSTVNTIAAMTALVSPSDGQQVIVRGYNVAGDGGGGTFTYEAASVAATDGILAFVPNSARVTFFETDGFDTSSLRGDRGTPFQGNWTVSTSYTQGDLVRDTGGVVFYWARQTHTSTAADEPGVGANQAAFWATSDDAFVESLVPNDHNSPLQHQDIVWGSFFFEYLGGAQQLFDLELHGHTSIFTSNGEPSFYTIPNSTQYKPFKLIWHKEGVVRDNAAFGLFGGLGLFLQEHDTAGELITYGYDYVTTAGRWVRELPNDAALTPAMIGAVPNDPTVDNYDRLAWLINAADDIGRKISLNSSHWYTLGHIVLPDDLVMEGAGRTNSGLRIPPETTRSALWWADVYHMCHVADPSDYDDDLGSADAIEETSGQFKVTATADVGGTIDVAYFFDATNPLWSDIADVVTFINTNTLTTINVPGTIDQGGGVFVEPAGTTKDNEPRLFLGSAEYAVSPAGDATTLTLRSFEIDGNASNNVAWLTDPDYSYFWLGGDSTPLSQNLRESARCSGLNVGTDQGRPIQDDLIIDLSNMWVHDTLGSCLLSPLNIKHFNGINVKLGNTLSGRVKYGGSGDWTNLELHGRSRTSVHRGYVENITGHKYRPEGETLPIWDGNDNQQNILATGVNRIKDSTFPFANQQFISHGVDFDLRESLFTKGIILSGNNVGIQGGVNGASNPLELGAAATQGLLQDQNIDLVFENITIPTSVPAAGLGFTSYGAMANSRMKYTFLETYTDDGGGDPSPSFPLPALPDPTQVMVSPLVVLQSKAPLSGTIAAENLRDRSESEWQVRAEHYVSNMIEVGNPPASADAIPMVIKINGNSFKNITNYVIGWGSQTAEAPTDVEDYKLLIVMERVGFRLFDPADTGGAIGDTVRRAFVGDESVIDSWLKIVKMTDCFMTNTGGEMIDIGGGQRQWDDVTFDPLDMTPKLWSETDTLVSFTATGAELINAGDGTFYHEIQPGLMWKPASVSVQARNKRTSDLSIPNYATIHRDPTTDSPINPLVRVYFTSQFTASDAVEFRVVAKVTS